MDDALAGNARQPATSILPLFGDDKQRVHFASVACGTLLPRSRLPSGMVRIVARPFRFPRFPPGAMCCPAPDDIP